MLKDENLGSPAYFLAGFLMLIVNHLERIITWFLYFNQIIRRFNLPGDGDEY